MKKAKIEEAKRKHLHAHATTRIMVAGLLMVMCIVGLTTIENTQASVILFPIIRHVIKQLPLSPAEKRQQIVDYITTTFGKHAQHALCIAEHESGLNPDAIHHEYNGTLDRGLFQINSSLPYDASLLFDWKQNTQVAYALSRRGTNWADWTTEHFCS